MKSYATYVMSLYDGIFSDAAIRWPDIRSTMDKDLLCLRSAFEHRGLAFFTLTLPAFGHWIDRSLDLRCFSDKAEIPRGIKLFRGRPRLFWGILTKVFDNDGMLKCDVDHEAVLFLRTLCQSLKKLEVPCRAKIVRQTLKEFYDVEAQLPKSYCNTWDCEIPDWQERIGHPLTGESVPDASEWPDLFGHTSSPGNHLPWDTLRELSRRVLSDLGVPDYWKLAPKHGPGAVSETGWGSKYEFPNWPKKLENWFPFDWFGAGDLHLRSGPGSDRELPSRLMAVPKSQKGPRLICCEPIAHQWMQQSIWRWVKGRIGDTVLGRSIDFGSQLESQRAALKASHDGSLATLDLSSASDRLSTRLVEYLFQGTELLDHFHACRTRAVEQTLDDHLPKMILLRKFSTMGSALTFPVQSIVFAILSVWALRLHEGRESDWSGWKRDFGRVRVFGDDIIVPSHVYGITKFVLHECGLRVNTQKSFGGSSFRESCGMDAFDGVDVTPARHTLPYSGNAPSTAALIMYSNNLFTKGLWKTSEKVLGWLPPQLRKLLVTSGPEDGVRGLVSFCGSDLHTHRRKWDVDLQRWYVQRLGFYAKVRYTPGGGWSSLTQFFTEDPAQKRDHHDGVLLWNSGRATPKRLKMRRFRAYM